jgi:ankyrin repeat protein
VEHILGIICSLQHDARGRNFLHLAIESKDIESVLFLLSINVDVNSRTKDTRQMSPLHLAVESQSELLVRMFWTTNYDCDIFIFEFSYLRENAKTTGCLIVAVLMHLIYVDC